jgi:glycosyltransferase involved in cell wall biosynthesis
MKQQTLLLSGTVPGSAHVGEIILRDLVSHYGPECMQCVAIVPERYRSTVDPSLAGLSVQILRSAHTHGRARGAGRCASLLKRLRFVSEFRNEVLRLTDAIIATAREGGVEQVFAVLNNSLIIAVAHRVSKALAVPLVTLVWDPPEYLFQQSRFDRLSRKSLHREFRESLAASTRVAVVSETMQRDYSAFTRAPIHLLRHGISLGGDRPALPLAENEWLIGFAGSMYSDCAWNALIRALDQAEWKVAGRPIRLRLLTGRIELASRGGARIDYLGFRPPAEVQAILESCHLTYMPQPFVPELAELCRYSFPTKLANYLALGRPVLVHCPNGSALAEYVERNPIGVHVASLDPGAILGALESVLGDTERYSELSSRASNTARSHFSDSTFHTAVDRVLSGSDAVLAEASR